MTILLMVIIALLSWLAYQFIDMNILNKRFIKNDLDFRFDKYWESERFAMALSWIVMAIFGISYNFIAAEYKPADGNIFRLCAAILTGGIGGWAMTLFFGRSKKWLANKLNEKMN